MTILSRSQRVPGLVVAATGSQMSLRQFSRPLNGIISHRR